MTDLRSYLCHGPDCTAKITDESPSDDFCSQACQARWQAAYVGVPADGGLLREGGGLVYTLSTGSGGWTPLATPDPALGWVEVGRADVGTKHEMLHGCHPKPSLLHRLWRWVWFRG
jgi:hypothetical protein